MSWTYTTLKQAIQDFSESNETNFVTNLDIIIKNAEDRIVKAVQFPDFRKNVTGSITASDKYLSIPTDFLAPYSLALDNSGYEYLIIKDVNFIREAYPVGTTEGTPKYYGILDDDYFILGPTPDSSYAVELHYFYKPTSIVTGSTSWLGDNKERLLLYGCLVEAALFIKEDSDITQGYEAVFQEELQKAKLLGEGRNRSDSYRSG